MKTSEQNLALVRTAYDAFAKGDVDTLRAMYTDDTVWHTPGNSPFNSEYKGADGVLGYFTQLFELSGGSFKVEPEQMYGDDERVVVLERVTGSRHGRHVDFRDVVVYEIRDGKFATMTQFEQDVKILDAFWA
jgi:ketosteroid isomerase-like protein